MNVLYLSSSYVPSRRASSVHVMKMCAAFARLGHDVTLVAKGCREREEPGVEQLHRFYGVPASFPVVKLPRPAWKGGGLLYLTAVARYVRRHREVFDLVYARDLGGAVVAARSGHAVIFEAHGPPSGAIGKALFRRLCGSRHLRGLVVISAALRDLLIARRLVPDAVRCAVAHDAADPAPTSGRESPSPALDDRRWLHVGYVGHLYAGRGVELILGLAERRPDCRFHLVGGTVMDLERLRREQLPDNVVAHGFVAPGRLPDYYARFDVVLMPYQPRVMVASGRTDTAAWMSPMKLFEYMAAGRAILSSDLPVLREVLEDGRNALLLPADSIESWDRALQRLRADAGLRQRLGAAARADQLARHTWERRAEAVLGGL